jgi:hypothetical protein
MRVNNELETMWREIIEAKFKAISWHLPGETGELVTGLNAS